MEDRQWVSANEIIEEFGFSKNKVYRLMHQELPTRRIGGSLLVERHDFENWLDRKRLEPIGKPNE